MMTRPFDIMRKFYTASNSTIPHMKTHTNGRSSSNEDAKTSELDQTTNTASGSGYIGYYTSTIGSSSEIILITDNHQTTTTTKRTSTPSTTLDHITSSTLPHITHKTTEVIPKSPITTTITTSTTSGDTNAIATSADDSTTTSSSYDITQVSTYSDPDPESFISSPLTSTITITNVVPSSPITYTLTYTYTGDLSDSLGETQFTSDGSTTIYYSQPYIITAPTETFTTTVETSQIINYSKDQILSSQTYSSVKPIVTDLNFYQNSLSHLGRTTEAGLGKSKITGISIGSILGFLLLSLVAIWYLRKNKKKRNSKNHDHDEEKSIGHTTQMHIMNLLHLGNNNNNDDNINFNMPPMIPSRETKDTTLLNGFEVFRPKEYYQSINADEPAAAATTTTATQTNKTVVDLDNPFPTTNSNAADYTPPPQTIPNDMDETTKRAFFESPLSIPTSTSPNNKPKRFMHILYEEDEDEMNDTAINRPIPPKPRKNLNFNGKKVEKRSENNEVIDTLTSISYQSGRLKSTTRHNNSPPVGDDNSTSSSSMITFSSDEFDYD